MRSGYNGRGHTSYVYTSRAGAITMRLDATFDPTSYYYFVIDKVAVLMFSDQIKNLVRRRTGNRDDQAGYLRNGSLESCRAGRKIHLACGEETGTMVDA
ncbi:hypothetical protein J6590_003088 [Homalodisca vitripennis]|nr:hypothetical protein J6590_003088 [Homalodisca vitripennis]